MTPEEIEALMRKAQPPEEVVVRDFIALYDSPCATCPDQIWEGDRAGYIGDDDEASCGECCQQAKR